MGLKFWACKHMKNAVIETQYIILENQTHIQKYSAPRELNWLNFIDFGSVIVTMVQVFLIHERMFEWFASLN